MVKLDYQTNNPRWGWTGIEYSSWNNYAFALGYLANELHYRNARKSAIGLIELHFEGNDLQGAWGKEGRIHYYGNLSFLQSNFPDWYSNRSNGNGSITCRINSNDYIYSLINDYFFEVVSTPGFTTKDLFPPYENPYDSVKKIMMYKIPNNCDREEMSSAFDEGWNL